MGGSTYSSTDRVFRATIQGFQTKSVEQIFTQRQIHKTMDPSGVAFREARDSEVHPLTVPLQLYLDVTGSMGHIPYDLIKTGLPTLISKIIENGVADIALLFGAVGDHISDSCPLQVGQFESGDEELDICLTRTYLEGNGGGNGGESYPLAWYFAGNHIETDAWDKRKQKGFLFTIGDEPFHPTLPIRSIREIMGTTAKGEATYKAEELLSMAQERNHVYHIFLSQSRTSGLREWKELMGENLIECKDFRLIPEIISKIVVNTSTLQQGVGLQVTSEEAAIMSEITLDVGHGKPSFIR